MHRLSRYVTAVTAVLCFVSSASAQGPANLRISVEDEVAGAINGVKLTLIHKTNGERREVTTDNAGRAAFEALPTGEYVLSAEAPGFQRLQRNVTVAANPSPLKLKMKIEVTEDVTVKEDVLPVLRIIPVGPDLLLAGSVERRYVEPIADSTCGADHTGSGGGLQRAAGTLEGALAIWCKRSSR